MQIYCFFRERDKNRPIFTTPHASFPCRAATKTHNSLLHNTLLRNRPMSPSRKSPPAPPIYNYNRYISKLKIRECVNSLGSYCSLCASQHTTPERRSTNSTSCGWAATWSWTTATGKRSKRSTSCCVPTPTPTKATSGAASRNTTSTTCPEPNGTSPSRSPKTRSTPTPTSSAHSPVRGRATTRGRWRILPRPSSCVPTTPPPTTAAG